MSVMVAVETTFDVACTKADNDIHNSAERVMVELVELSEAGVILDGSTAADSGKAEVTISVTVEADSLGDGVNAAITAMRNAIHSAGNATPAWPSHKDWMDGLVGQSMHAEVIPAATAAIEVLSAPGGLP